VRARLAIAIEFGDKRASLMPSDQALLALLSSAPSLRRSLIVSWTRAGGAENGKVSRSRAHADSRSGRTEALLPPDPLNEAAAIGIVDIRVDDEVAFVRGGVRSTPLEGERLALARR
jgi:hypothetical protein